jgi:hypothetical protein
MALDGTYDGLKASVADWLNRADLTAQIPDFIALAEARFNRDLRLNSMLQRDTTVATSDYVALPLDWLEHVSIAVVNDGTVYKPLTYVSNEEFNRLRLQNLTGTFRYYTIQDTNIALLPEMSAGSVTLEIFYYGKIPALSVSNASNWLLARAPDLYLYSSLMAADVFLQNDDRLQIWVAAAQAAMESLRLESERAKRSQGLLKTPTRTFG